MTTTTLRQYQLNLAYIKNKRFQKNRKIKTQIKTKVSRRRFKKSLRHIIAFES